ncbi:hypothetical protein LTS15_000203 [Exophiala xenobiotica]|nr:hypothetical protein LTS15_000203 [Exophiala xenobiotica]
MSSTATPQASTNPSQASQPTGHTYGGWFITTQFEVRFIWNNAWASDSIMLPAGQYDNISDIWEEVKRQLPSHALIMLKEDGCTLPYFYLQDKVLNRITQAPWHNNRAFVRWFARNLHPIVAPEKLRIEIQCRQRRPYVRADGGLEFPALPTFNHEYAKFGASFEVEATVDELGEFHPIEVEEPNPDNEDEEEDEDEEEALRSSVWLRE